MSTSTAAAARRVADDRRSLLTLFTGPYRQSVALDLMGIAPGRGTEAQHCFAAQVADCHASTLRRADLILTDEDMSVLVGAATPSMPDQVLREDDPLSPYGFVGFAVPLTDGSGQPPLLPIEALSWAFLPAGHPVIEGQRAGAPSGVLLTAYVRAGAVAPAPPGLAVPRLVPNATVMWSLGSETGQAYGAAPVPGATPAFYQRLAAAFWTLAKQPLAASTAAALPPKDRRRYARAGVENPAAAVRVVHLHSRTTDAPADASPSGRAYRHRHLVRGYWRNTWFGTLQTHRQQWIDGYVRGPQNAPLLTGEKVLLARPGSAGPPAGPD
jgi:hypothetical protein